MKHHRKTVGKHTQKKNGMRKTMKGGYWPFTSETTTETTTETPSKTLTESISDFVSSLLPKKTDTPVTPVTPLPQPNNNNNTGGYMGGKRKGKTAKKPCPKKGGGK